MCFEVQLEIALRIRMATELNITQNKPLFPLSQISYYVGSTASSFKSHMIEVSK